MLLLILLLTQLPLDYGSQQLTAAASDVITAAADVTADDMSSPAVMAANETVVDSTTESLLGRRYQSPYSVEELLNLKLPRTPGQDIDMDPCKAGSFIGDIAYPQGALKNKEKKKEEFDVRDTMSEPRVESGLIGYKPPTAEGALRGAKSMSNKTMLHEGSTKRVHEGSMRGRHGKVLGKGGSLSHELGEESLSRGQTGVGRGKSFSNDKQRKTSLKEGSIKSGTVQKPFITHPHPSVRPYTPSQSKTVHHKHSVMTNETEKQTPEPIKPRTRLSKANRKRHRRSRRNKMRSRHQKWRQKFLNNARKYRTLHLDPDHHKSIWNITKNKKERKSATNVPQKIRKIWMKPEQQKKYVKNIPVLDEIDDDIYDEGDEDRRLDEGWVREDIRVHGRRKKRAATARPERIWDYAVIPYEIDANFSGVHKALFKQAMRHWENYTCIQFVQRTPEHPNWIVFTERPCGCCSFVGKRGNGPQAISIGKNCDKFGIVVHELGHVVGFWHEHTRPDRDSWVSIIRDNVINGQDYNFNKLTSEEVNSLGLKYDYDSIMHYAKNTFSKGTYLDTILPRSDLPENEEKMPEIGQRIRLSKGDIMQTSALYQCPACGKTYQETSGKFSSPQHQFYTHPASHQTSRFRKGDKCEWRILATHGEKIVLNITSLDIPSSHNCNENYLEIRDGYWYKSPMLAKLCGNIQPAPIISTGSRLMLTYMTSESTPDHKGFIAQYEAICGGELNAETGTLESPNFPEDYQPSKECIWKIKVSEEFQVALKFQSFEIENHDNCVYDYLEIRDGDSANSKLIGTYCGYKMPKDIKSSTNSLYIKFVSDGSVQKAGFSASFMKEYDECQSPNHGCEHECINTLGGYECKCRLGYELHSDDRRCENACGGLIDASNGTITSPSFPDIYPSNKNCIWEIIAPPQWRITINFTHFDIEGNNQDCEYDSLEISSKLGSSEIRQHGLFCGNRLPQVITSEGNSLRLEFTSDNSVQKNGFAAIFFTDKDECATNNGGCQHICRNTIGAYYCACHQGFVLHENGHGCKEGGCKHEISSARGEISSPHYPDHYPGKKECVWIFSTIAGHRIKLLFTEFELEPHQECAYDHIVVYDGHTTSQQILGRFCGSKLPHPLIASDSSMLLVFKSDASVQRKGFMAEHMTVCGGHLEADSTEKSVFSHAKYGDMTYENKVDCDWIIEAPQDERVHLMFTTFELEGEQDCGYDHVEIFSGYDDTGSSYGRYCGSNKPPQIVSEERALLLRFKSDDTINGKGFAATYNTVDKNDKTKKKSVYNDYVR